MARILEREKAKLMRREGASLGEISSALQVGKSTISYWCRDIPLSEQQLMGIQERSRKAGVSRLMQLGEDRRRARIINIAECAAKGQKDVGCLHERDLFMLGLGLYWGEGYKKGNDEVGFSNSDPNAIVTMIQWFRQVYGVEKENLILRVSINGSHKKRALEIVNYWSTITKIPQSQFTKTSFIQSVTTKKYLDSSQYFGTLRIKVRRGTALKRRILGSLQALAVHEG